MKLRRRSTPLTTTVSYGDITSNVVGPYDVMDRLDELVSFTPWRCPVLPARWGIGLIVGASGSGKSLLLDHYFGGPDPAPVWDPGLPIVEHFDAVDAAERFAAVGLNDVPTWLRPYHVLSTGQRFRADLARLLGNEATVDEYTSVVSRPVAKSTSRALHRWVRATGTEGIVLASCHRDIEAWLCPDWTIDTDSGTYTDSGGEPPSWRALVGDAVGALVDQ